MKLSPIGLSLSFCLAAAATLLSADAPAGDANMAKPPTEQEVIAYFVKDRTTSAMNDSLRPALKVEVNVTDIKIGGKIQKVTGLEGTAHDVWAVKAKVHARIFLKNGSEQTRDFNLGAGEAFFFFRDPFGEWTAKHGPM